MSISRLPPGDRRPKWLVADYYLPLTDAQMAGGRFELAMEPTAIGLVSVNSNSETHMTAICDARLIYGTCYLKTCLRTSCECYKKPNEIVHHGCMDPALRIHAGL